MTKGSREERVGEDCKVERVGEGDGSVWGWEREAAWRRTNPWDEGSTVEVEAMAEDRRWKHNGGGEAVEEDRRWKP